MLSAEAEIASLLEGSTVQHTEEVAMIETERKPIFKKARRKRLNKLRRKRKAKEMKNRWSSFVMGMVQSSGKKDDFKAKKKTNNVLIGSSKVSGENIDESQWKNWEYQRILKKYWS